MAAEFASRAATGRPAQLRFAQPRYVTTARVTARVAHTPNGGPLPIARQRSPRQGANPLIEYSIGIQAQVSTRQGISASEGPLALCFRAGTGGEGALWVGSTRSYFISGTSAHVLSFRTGIDQERQLRVNSVPLVVARINSGKDGYRY